MEILHWPNVRVWQIRAVCEPPQLLQLYQLTPQRKVHLLTRIICLLNCGATYHVKLFKFL